MTTDPTHVPLAARRAGTQAPDRTGAATEPGGHPATAGGTPDSTSRHGRRPC